MKYVNQSINKIDSMALVTGKPVYTEDITPRNCLVVKVLRSPHAFAKIIKINKEIALKVPGIECILTYEDVPNNRFTMAGQSYPEMSPYDRLILDQTVRYVGDPVAVVAGINEKVVDKAIKIIKVTYELYEPVLNMDDAIDHTSIIHSEDNYHVNVPIGNEVQRNICSSGTFTSGDVEAELAKCPVIVDQRYHTKANNCTPMETFRTFTYLDYNGRINITTSTQVPFHVRRIVATALDIPKSKVRVIKPRIGGGFGAKQTIVSEIFPALVTLKTGKAASLIFDRKESFIGSTSRHEMKMHVRIGADIEGNIKAIYLHTLSNTGAYGEHGPTTVGLSGHKTLPIYNKAKAFWFEYEVVYTNTMSAGAYRGYGATQGAFAVESAVNELAEKLHMDPIELRRKNLLEVEEVMPAYYYETLKSCALDRCIQRGKELIRWDELYPYKKISDTKVRSVGMAVTMQGSSIANVDTASVEIKLNDDGFYTLMIGATDMGTGCDTILSQMAAEELECSMEKIIVHGVDTDFSPFDTGSYASSTTYLTGMAVVKACEKMRQLLIDNASRLLVVDIDSLIFEGDIIKGVDTQISVSTIAQKIARGNGEQLVAAASHSSTVSPPPFMAGFAEVEVDLETGKTDIVNYVGVVDCGTPINPDLARVQTEGGIVQGIGMALFEDITYNELGGMRNNSFMQYRIPTRLDMGNIHVEFESSYEPTGPYGAKSIGEVVINTPSPAIAHAIYNATGVHHRALPITAEKVLMGMINKRIR